MSATATATVAVRRSAPSTRPALRLAPAPKRRVGRLIYLACCLAIVVGGLVGMLSFNTALAKGAFEILQMERDLAGFEATANKLEERLIDQTVPENLAAKAAALGMAPAPSTSYILLQEGVIIGAVGSQDQAADE